MMNPKMKRIVTGILAVLLILAMVVPIVAQYMT